ncbi:phosphoheptose isomerase [Leptospira mayottensis]|uniref:phosphoheptose isomerase n=1 Tax=Leptospira mayottensis TaxID=1137606 RepID=UPI001013CC12|nr:phosphoheptose isomerase [Leptospira mayottensis]
MDTISCVAITLYKAKENSKNIFFSNEAVTDLHLIWPVILERELKTLIGKCQKYFKVFGLGYGLVNCSSKQCQETREIPPTPYAHGYNGVGRWRILLMVPGDVLFGIFSSGNSPNVINAFICERKRSKRMVGFDEGQAAKMVLFVPSRKGKYGIVEGFHKMIHHLLYEFAVLIGK